MIKSSKTRYLSVFCTFFWCALHNSFAWDKILIGFLLALFVNFLYRRFLAGPSSPSHSVPLSVLWRYPFLLLAQIAKSGFFTARLILQNDVAPVLAILPCRLKNEWLRTIVANSITLTPGRVSVELTADHYIVLCIGAIGQNPENLYRQIAEPFETLLMKGDTDA